MIPLTFEYIIVGVLFSVYGKNQTLQFLFIYLNKLFDKSNQTNDEQYKNPVRIFVNFICVRQLVYCKAFKMINRMTEFKRTQFFL